MGKIKTVEIVVRGDIIEKNIILKLANRLKVSKLRADFSSSIAVPPFLEAIEKRYPSLAILYGTVDIEDLFQFKALVEDLCCDEECLVVSFTERARSATVGGLSTLVGTTTCAMAQAS